jgi:hypothetical protein
LDAGRRKDAQKKLAREFEGRVPELEGSGWLWTRRVVMRRAPIVRLVAVLMTLMVAVLISGWGNPVTAGSNDGAYRVLKPIQSGDLTLFPVVRVDGKATPADQFLTLDEGLKSGEVEVTEAGKVRGLVRPRGGVTQWRFTGDQVNTLVLVNNSKRPLLLLAGEIVTGGKQDRVIAKDRIVPAGADPIDLSVFCIEHWRWTESSAKFGATARNSVGSFMVQPTVRQQAMVAKDQQKVWNSVNGAISTMAMATAAPSAPGGSSGPIVESLHGRAATPGTVVDGGAALGTTSYAKAMRTQVVSAKVDEETSGALKSREQALATLRQEHAVGVVVAVRGEIIWADIFSDTELLAQYWIKLVRSYAAEGLGSGASHGTASTADAQSFLDAPSHGTEDSEGEVGIYRYSEVKSGETDIFTLQSLLPGTGYDVHVSKLKLKGLGWSTRP